MEPPARRIADGAEVTPNFPTEENFTSPDARGTAGEGLGIGNPQRIIEAMKKWEACGVDRVNFILNCMEEIPPDKVLASLRLFATEVMPHFQAEDAASVRLHPVGSAAK